MAVAVLVSTAFAMTAADYLDALIDTPGEEG